MTPNDHAGDPDSTGAGFALGPAILAVFAAHAFYRTVCHGWPQALRGLDMGGWPLAPLFAVFLLYLAIKTASKLERAAWLTFAASFGVSTIVWATGLPLGQLAAAAVVAAAVLLTIVGVRRKGPRQFAIAALVFVLVFAGILLAQRQGERLSGRGTVFREARICA